MHIKLTPVRRDDRLTLHRAGDVLTINGDDLDMSAIPDGATLPRAAVDCDWLASDIERIDDVLHLTLLLPHGQYAPVTTRFPASIIDPDDGPITLPDYGEEPEVTDYAD